MKLHNVISAFNANTTANNKTNNTTTNTPQAPVIPTNNQTNSNNSTTQNSHIGSAINLLSNIANITSNQTSNGTNAIQGKNNATDAVGVIGSSNFSVTEPPYMVKDCNQIFLVDAERIINMEDYSKREKALFTMTIYIANIFQSKDINKLVDSITMDRMVQPPTHIPGAPGCLNFAADSRNIAFCVKDMNIANQLVQAYFDFHNCREGKRPLTAKDIMRLLMECEKHVASLNTTKTVHTGAGANAGQSVLTALSGTNTTSNSALNAVDNPASNKPLSISPYYANLKVPGTI
jgi:hypothetical protein